MTRDSVQAGDAGLPDASARRQIFGTVAEMYDRIRPGYPAGLIEDVVGCCDGARARAVEAGAGTGKATLAFAGRGMRITAVEPDPAMASVLAANCAGHPDVNVVVSRFEEYRPAGPADLVYSAQAWHWLDPETRLDHAAAVLTPGGKLALFWNFDRIADTAVQEEVSQAHRELAPHMAWETSALAEHHLLGRGPGQELAACAAFADVRARLYRWERTLTGQEYLEYLATHSLYLLLDARVREELFARIGAAVGERVLLAEDTALYLARRV